MPKKLEALDSGTVVRYCSKTKAIILDDKHQPTPSCFNLREGERCLSVYLLESSEQSTKIENLKEVKREMAKRNFKCKPTGLFALLDIVDSQREFELHERKIFFGFEEDDLPHCSICHEYTSAASLIKIRI